MTKPAATSPRKAAQAGGQAPAKADDPPPKDAPSGPGQIGLSKSEQKDVEASSRLSARMIYEILRREGEEEMSRPATSLVWSGVAAGLSISFSLVAQGLLQSHLPDTPWRTLITSLGYTLGFLIAVLARHQLFTEQTITAVLPVAVKLTRANLGRLGRLWGLVLAANLAGTLVAALFCAYTPAIPPDLRAAMLDISHHSFAPGPVEVFAKAIVAGFLIAGMVWLLPSAGAAAQVPVIFLMTYVIALGGFAHVVAGSFEGFMLVADGQLGIWPMMANFEAPALLGNIIGGTMLFSLISYGQIAKEM